MLSFVHFLPKLNSGIELGLKKGKSELHSLKGFSSIFNKKEVPLLLKM